MEAMHRCDSAAGGRKEWERRWRAHQEALDALKAFLNKEDKTRKTKPRG